jgi:hypothetical protein
MISYRLYRLRRQIGCAIGLHDLVGYKDCGNGVDVAPFNPRGLPGPDCSRKCNWCGARWTSAYDPMWGPFWKRSPRKSPGAGIMEAAGIEPALGSPRKVPFCRDSDSTQEVL